MRCGRMPALERGHACGQQHFYFIYSFRHERIYLSVLRQRPSGNAKVGAYISLDARGTESWRFAKCSQIAANGGKKLKPTPTMSPQERDRYAQCCERVAWKTRRLNSINQTQKPALQMAN